MVHLSSEEMNKKLAAARATLKSDAGKLFLLTRYVEQMACKAVEIFQIFNPPWKKYQSIFSLVVFRQPHYCFGLIPQNYSYQR